ncbi:MAG: hypothetical protein N2039_06360 [Gemmataceae bacterium]|nr:hypothetical protein [Gemmataceae bacterium]
MSQEANDGPSRPEGAAEEVRLPLLNEGVVAAAFPRPGPWFIEVSRLEPAGNA